MNTYLKMKKKHEAEFNAFPIVYAFNQQQFNEGMKKLGLKSTDTDMVFKSGGGGFYKKTDSKKLRELLDSLSKEMEDAIKGDLTGNGFIFEMFNHELSNHEYCITNDLTDTLEALDITIEKINDTPALRIGLDLAISNQYDSGTW